MRTRLVSLIAPLIFIVLWQGVYSSRIINAILIPSPLAVAEALAQSFATMTGLSHILSTVGRAILGLMGGVALGLFAGMIIGISRSIHQLVWVWVNFARSISAPALIPLFLLLFGIGESPRIFLIILVVALLIIVSTVTSLHNGSVVRRRAAQSLGYTKRELLIRVILIDAIPQLSTGVRLAISFSLIIAIVSEMFIGTEFGIGRAILNAQLTYETPTMYAYIVIAGILGQASNTLYDQWEQKYIHWKGR